MNRRPLLLSALTVALVGLVNGATAQAAWPSRPIRLVVPARQRQRCRPASRLRRAPAGVTRPATGPKPDRPTGRQFGGRPWLGCRWDQWCELCRNLFSDQASAAGDGGVRQWTDRDKPTSQPRANSHQQQHAAWRQWPMRMRWSDQEFESPSTRIECSGIVALCICGLSCSASALTSKSLSGC